METNTPRQMNPRDVEVALYREASDAARRGDAKIVRARIGDVNWFRHERAMAVRRIELGR